MIESLSILKNVNIIKNKSLPLENLLELKYWTKILEEFFASDKKNQFQHIRFYLVFENIPVVIDETEGIINVFIIADEHQRLNPSLYDGKNIIFQAYYSPLIFENAYPKIYAFPLGYNGKLSLENEILFSERKVNVFFSGNLHKGRTKMFDFYSYLRYLPFFLQHRLQGKIKSVYDKKYPDSYIRFTNGFMQGLNFDDYTGYIKNCKIVLTPRGSVVEECFRHYEAMKCGCIIISERLPQNHFFSGSPIIQIDDWKDADLIIKSLLSNPVRMQELHLAALRWWNDVMSESAVARYMAGIISQNEFTSK